MKATIKQAKRFKEDQNGNPYIGKDGKPYTRLLIQIEGNDETLSGFDNDKTASWKEGTVVDIEIEKKVVGDKTYWNFKLPNKFDYLEQRVIKLEAKVFPQTNEINVEDIQIN